MTPLTSRKNELLLTSSAFYVSVREQAEKPAWRGTNNVSTTFILKKLSSHVHVMILRTRTARQLGKLVQLGYAPHVDDVVSSPKYARPKDNPEL